METISTAKLWPTWQDEEIEIPEYSLICTFFPTLQQCREMQEVANATFVTTAKEERRCTWYLPMICHLDPSPSTRAKACKCVDSYQELKTFFEENGGEYSNNYGVDDYGRKVEFNPFNPAEYVLNPDGSICYRKIKFID